MSLHRKAIFGKYTPSTSFIFRIALSAVHVTCTTRHANEIRAHAILLITVIALICLARHPQLYALFTKALYKILVQHNKLLVLIL